MIDNPGSRSHSPCVPVLLREVYIQPRNSACEIHKGTQFFFGISILYTICNLLVDLSFSNVFSTKSFCFALPLGKMWVQLWQSMVNSLNKINLSTYYLRRNCLIFFLAVLKKFLNLFRGIKTRIKFLYP